jgi:uncharacterized Ntn-hydrolase superfamily protein
MKKLKSIFTLCILFTMCFHFNSFSTFSIAAVDTVTKQVGVAGASCIDRINRIGWVSPGIGALNAQYALSTSNRDHAGLLMDNGFSPEEILDSMAEYDNNHQSRQYDLVDLVNNGRSAAFTGRNAALENGYILGKTYAIAGNTLLGEYVLDSMENRFLETEGTLADKLMAALQGAKFPGADNRCDNGSLNKSSISAILMVAKPDDNINNLYLDLDVEDTDIRDDPIDEIQVLYDEWLATNTIADASVYGVDPLILSQNSPNPFVQETNISYHVTQNGMVSLKIYATDGREIVTLVNENRGAGKFNVSWDGKDKAGNLAVGGVYIYRLETKSTVQTRRMLLLR